MQEIDKEMINVWVAIFGDRPVTTRQIIISAMDGSDATAPLRKILEDVAPSSYPSTYSPNKLGRWLAAIAGRRITTPSGIPYVLVDRGMLANRGRTWQLESLDDDTKIDIGGMLASSWWRTFMNRRMTPKSVIVAAMREDEKSDLRAALSKIAPSPYPGGYSPHKLGRWLVKSAEREFTTQDGSSYVFVDHGTVDGLRTWQLLPSTWARTEQTEDVAA